MVSTASLGLKQDRGERERERENGEDDILIKVFISTKLNTFVIFAMEVFDEDHQKLN